MNQSNATKKAPNSRDTKNTHKLSSNSIDSPFAAKHDSLISKTSYLSSSNPPNSGTNSYIHSDNESIFELICESSQNQDEAILSQLHQLSVENKKLKKIIIQLKKNQLNANNSQQTDEVIENLEAKIVNLQNKIRSQQLEKEELKSNLAKSQYEVEILTNNQNHQEKPNHQTNEVHLMDTLNLIENMISTQNNDISEISAQKDQLFNLVIKLNSVNQILEEQLNHSIENSKEKQRETNDLKRKCSQLQEKNEIEMDYLLTTIINIFSTPTKQADDYFQVKTQTIADNLNSAIQRKLDEIQTKSLREQISDICTFISDHLYKTFNEIQKSFVISNSKNTKKEHTSRELALLGQLENCIKFIQQFSNTNPDLNKDDRTFILSQISRISTFINEEIGPDAIPEVLSLFEENDPYEQAKEFFDFMEQTEEEDETQVRELFSLFKMALITNSFFFEHFQKAADEMLHMKQDLFTANENEKTIQLRYDQLCEKVESMQSELNDFYSKTKNLNESSDPFQSVSKLIGGYNKLHSRSKKTDQQLKKMKKDFDEFKNESEIKVNEQLQAENEELKKKINNMEQMVQEDQNLKQEVKEALEKLEVLKSLSKQESDKHQKERKKFDRIKQQLAQIQNENDKLRSELNETKSELLTAKDTKKKFKTRIEQLETELYQSQLSTQSKTMEFEKSKQVQQKQTQKTEENIKRYDMLLEKLNQELNECREKIVVIEKEKSELIKANEEMKNENCRLKLTEKTINLKIKQQEFESISSIKNETAKSESKLMSLKVEFDELLNDYQKKLVTIKDDLLNIIHDYFSFMVMPTTIESDELNSSTLLRSNYLSKETSNSNEINKIYDLIEQSIRTISNCIASQTIENNEKTISEANTIRVKCGLTSTDSILDKFNAMEKHINQIEEKLNYEKQLNEQKEKEKIELKETITKMTQNEIEYQNWRKWSNSMYRQINDDCMLYSPEKVNSRVDVSSKQSPFKVFPLVSQEDLRAALEECILASIGHKSILKTIGTLRQEKKIMKKVYGQLFDNYRSFLFAFNKPPLNSLLLEATDIDINSNQSVGGVMSPYGASKMPAGLHVLQLLLKNNMDNYHYYSSFLIDNSVNQIAYDEFVSIRHLILISVFIKRLRKSNGFASSIGNKSISLSLNNGSPLKSLL